MAKKSHAEDVVEWTVTYAPEPGETPVGVGLARPRLRSDPTASGARRWTLNWRLAVIAASPLLLALLAVGLSNGWNAYRLRRDISAVVAAEDRAAQAGDLAAARGAYAPANEAWFEGQLRRVENQQPAPLPMHGFWPASGAGVVRAVRATGPTAVRADVARRFFAPDGSPTVFVVAQYYGFANGQWRRVPAPIAAADVRQWRGAYVDSSYFAKDEALVIEISAALDEMTAQVCARWICPGGLRFDLRFLLDDTAPLRGFDYFAPAPSAPILYTVLLAEREAYYGSLTLTLPAPHLAGLPADAASHDTYRRVISLELLARLAGLLAPDGQNHNALHYALAARLGAELGLEPAEVAQVSAAEAVLSAEALWDFNFISTERPFGPYYTQAAQRQALAAVNNLLLDQPPEIASRLYRSLPSADDPVAWVGDALNLSPAEAASRLQAALDSPFPPLASTPLGRPGELLLGCASGLAVTGQDLTSLRLGLAGRGLDARPVAWSPGGDYLLLYLLGRPAVVQARTGTISWLPETGGYVEHLQWVNDTTAAYTVWPYDPLRRQFDPSQFMLRFFDAAQPDQSPAPLAGVLAYRLAPDGSTAAIVQADPAARVFSRSGRMALMPALGGPLRPLGEGQQPTWSPDGDLLAFARIAGDAAVLHVLDPATGADRAVFDSGAHDIHSAFFEVELSWSPAGHALALVLEEDVSNEHTVWLIPTTGGPARLVAAHATPAQSNPARFSADGHYLAVSEWNRYWSRLTRVYEAATGEEVLSLPAAAGETAWAPNGHQLALSSLEGLTLMAEPGRARGRALAGEPCHTALWN
jgi:hypothetical protein